MSLKHLRNFWRILDITLIKYEVNLVLTWTQNCAITSKAYGEAVVGDNQLLEIKAPTNSTYKITDTKFYVPVVTLSTEYDNELSEISKARFKRTIKWNKYRLKMSNQTKNNSFNYIIDPTFNKVNRLFVLSFENKNDRTYFSRYYVSNVQIKNVLIDSKSFFDTPIKNKEETYEQNMEMGRNNDYPAGNLLDYEYFAKHYRLIEIDLSKQIESQNPDLKQQINLIRRLERDKGATMLFIIKISEETTFGFLQNSVTIVRLLTVYNGYNLKIVNLLVDADKESSKFATRKWYVSNDENNTDNGEENENDSGITFETKVTKANLCDYSDAYILLKVDIAATGGNANTKVAFKNYPLFTTRVTHIDNEHVDTAEHLDIIMPMYDLIDSSDKYSDTIMFMRV